jgi:hypothetical protein
MEQVYRSTPRIRNPLRGSIGVPTDHPLCLFGGHTGGAKKDSHLTTDSEAGPGQLLDKVAVKFTNPRGHTLVLVEWIRALVAAQ